MGRSMGVLGLVEVMKECWIGEGRWSVFGCRMVECIMVFILIYKFCGFVNLDFCFKRKVDGGRKDRVYSLW